MLVAVGASPAAAATPAWTVRATAEPYQFASSDATACAEGKCDRYELAVLNSGDGASTEPITLIDRLPKGIVPQGALSGANYQGTEIPAEEGGTEWACSQSEEAPEEWVLTCTFAEGIPSGTYAPHLEIFIAPPAESSGSLKSEVSVSGGGAVHAGSTTLDTAVGSQAPEFGITDFSIEAAEANGEAALRAGAHPWQVTTSLGFPLIASPPSTAGEEHAFAPVENLKKVVVELPLGFAGDPLATTEQCTGTQLKNGGCPPGSRVGTLAFSGAGFTAPAFRFTGTNVAFNSATSVFNMKPEGGYPGQLAFLYASQEINLYANTVHSAAGERLRVTAPALPAIVGTGYVSLTIWGKPGAHNGSGSDRPFLSNPTSCAPGTARAEVESWENPGTVVSRETTVYPQLTGCDELVFDPGFSLLPETGAADSPSGLDVDLGIPQTANFEERATPQLKDATVTLPAGLAADPALADGLGACQASGPEGINLGSTEIGPLGSDLGNPFATEFGAGHLGGNASPYDDGVYHSTPGHCPLASTLGTAEVTAPILPEPLTGHVYLGTPDCSPCSSKDAEEGKLIKLYIEVEGNGVIAKLPGSVSVDPSTGRLTATFKENPQLPFEDLKLNFFGGPRAALSTPPTCGKYTTTTDLKPWSAPETPDATPTSSFEVSTGPGGGACANSAAQEPHTPAFTAGTLTPAGGAYSPFELELTRADGTQRLKGIDTTLPAGLVAKLAGVPYCSEAQIASAANHSGAGERAAPSCPAASEVGTVNVGAGAGPNPFHVSGHAYLAGPYKSAPISLAIVTPAVAGPFDLGTVVVRVALYVNPETAVVTAKSDPLPQILAGIPLDLRSVAVNLSRPSFTLNPTSCNKTAVTGNALSVLDQSAALSSPFQVGGCSALGFNPKLAISLKGGTRRTKHPALTATVTMKPGEANIARAQVTLPHSAFLDQSHIRTVCTRVQFAAHACPPASVYGKAIAYTPLLDQPLSGPVYLRSSSNKLPDLVADLNGQIEVALAGKVDTGKNGGIRNTFEVVPDAPVSKFVLSMRGGSRGLLVNSENICRKPQHASAHFVAQNGKVSDTTPLIANDCKAKGKFKKRGHRHH